MDRRKQNKRHKKVAAPLYALSLLWQAKAAMKLEREWRRFDAKLQPFERKVKQAAMRHFQKELKVLLELFRRYFYLHSSSILQGQDGLHSFEIQVSNVLDDTWDDWIEELQLILVQVSIAFGSDTALGLGLAWNGMSGEFSNWLRNYVPRLADQLNRTTLDKIVEAVGDGFKEGKTIPQIVDDIKELYSDFERSRPDVIARTETGKVASMAQQDMIRHMPFEVVEIWSTSLDEKVRPSHQALEGQKRKPGEDFLPGLKFPRDPDGPIEEVVNCRCVLVLERAA